MRFSFTPQESQVVARAVARYFRRKRMRVIVEAPAWQDAPYRTTLVVVASYSLRILIECQDVINYARAIMDLAAWLAAERRYAELYLATASEAVLRVGVLEETKRDGVGLLIVNDNGKVSESQSARNPALVVTPDPTLKLGGCKDEVTTALKKFNNGNRKDGLRDMCEIVERLTEEAGVAACRKGLLKIPETEFKKKDWASQINELARQEAYHSGHRVLVNSTLKDDLHSFRNARNLVGHKVRNRREEIERLRQFAERMMQGPRLAGVLVSLRRRVK